MTFQTLLAKYRNHSFSERDKGDRFERLMQAYLKTDPQYACRFKNIWLWNEFPCRKDLGGKDSGNEILLQNHPPSETRQKREKTIVLFPDAEEYLLLELIDQEYARPLFYDSRKIKPYQGVRFKSATFIGAITKHPFTIMSMDEHGRAQDNIVVKRLWRSIKHEDIYKATPPRQNYISDWSNTPYFINVKSAIFW